MLGDFMPCKFLTPHRYIDGDAAYAEDFLAEWSKGR